MSKVHLDQGFGDRFSAKLVLMSLVVILSLVSFTKADKQTESLLPAHYVWKVVTRSEPKIDLLAATEASLESRIKELDLSTREGRIEKKQLLDQINWASSAFSKESTVQQEWELQYVTKNLWKMSRYSYATGKKELWMDFFCEGANNFVRVDYINSEVLLSDNPNLGDNIVFRGIPELLIKANVGEHSKRTAVSKTEYLLTEPENNLTLAIETSETGEIQKILASYAGKPTYAYALQDKNLSTFTIFDSSIDKKVSESKWELISKDPIINPLKADIEFQLKPGYRVEINTAEQKATDIPSEDIIDQQNRSKK